MGFDNVNVNVSGPAQPTSTYKTKVLKGNHSFASQVTEPNTKYVIKHNFDLGGGSVTIPEGCVLEFDGGSISNGIITGQNTAINAELVKILNTNVTLAGSWSVTEAYPEWFGAKGDGSIDDTKTIQSCINLVESNNGGIVYINKGIYLISDTLYIHKSNIKIVGAGKFDTILKPSPSMIGDYDSEDGTFNVKAVIYANNSNQKIIKTVTLPIETGYRFGINSSEGLDKNMLVYIKSNELWTCENRGTAKKGETNLIRSFDDDYCYTDALIAFNYTSEETLDVQFVKPLEGIEIRNIGISPDINCPIDERHYRGILVNGCYGAVIDSCYGFGCGTSCIESINSYKTHITNNVVRQAYSYYNGSIYGLGYALRCSNDRLGVIKNNIVDEARHGFDLSGGYPSIGIEVSGNTINSSVSEFGAGSTHGPAYECTIKNNIISGPCSLNIRGEKINIENNTLKGNIINYFGRNTRYVGNIIYGYISFGKPDTVHKTNFTVIKDNEFWSNSIFYLLTVDGVSYDVANNFIIENNIVHTQNSSAYCVNVSNAGGNVVFGQGFVYKNNVSIVNHPTEGAFAGLRFVNNESDYNIISFGNNKWEVIVSDASVAQNVSGKTIIGTNIFQKSINSPVWYNGTQWITANGAKSGTPVTGKFSQRPTVAADIFQGFKFMINDADLGLHFPIFAQISGSNINWYKADGTLYTGE